VNEGPLQSAAPSGGPGQPAVRAVIRCVAVDAVGTLIEANPPVVDAYAEAGRRHGSGLDRDEVSRRLSRAFATCSERDREGGASGLVTSEELEWTRWRWIVGEVFQELGSVGAVDRCFEELFEHFGQASSWRCYDDVEATVSRIEQLGLGMVIASNFDRRLHTVCAGWPVLRSVLAVVVSSEVGCRKPGRGFFEALVSACGCRAEEVLMVGDDAVNDVEGAVSSGLQAVHVDRSLAAVTGPTDWGSVSRPSVIGSLSELEAWYR